MICVYQCQEKQRIDLLLAMVPQSALCGSSASPQLPAWAVPAPGALWAAAAVGRGKMPLGCEPGGPGLLCLPQDAFILQLFREGILCHGAVAHVWRA